MRRKRVVVSVREHSGAAMVARREPATRERHARTDGAQSTAQRTVSEQQVVSLHYNDTPSFTRAAAHRI